MAEAAESGVNHLRNASNWLTVRVERRGVRRYRFCGLAAAIDGLASEAVLSQDIDLTGGPLKPGFGLSGAFLQLGRVLLLLFRLFVSSIFDSISTSPYTPLLVLDQPPTSPL